MQVEWRTVNAFEREKNKEAMHIWLAGSQTHVQPGSKTAAVRQVLEPVHKLTATLNAHCIGPTAAKNTTGWLQPML